ncbi:M1 family aminopeptidase [Maribellus mangrovi]|uniref:M1 family aminopeptidase n=1 Tax=Maribellus mangrovi TaxID=3133146 RepID=UPI0030EB8CBB
MIRSIGVTLFLIVLFIGAKSQDIFLGDTTFVVDEKKAFLNTRSFVESGAYNETDFVYQRMEWEIDPAVRYISGKVTSHFKSKVTELDTLYMDLHQNLQVDSIVYHNSSIAFIHSVNKLIILLSEMNSGTIDSVSIYYRGVPPSSGFGSFEANTHGPGNTPVLWTLSEPYGAMEWWPCKQSLADKIDSMDIIVSTPEIYRTASNGVVISDEVENGRRVMHWKHRYPIATYLVAIAVTNYATYSDTLYLNDGRSIDILNYVYPEQLEDTKTKTGISTEIMQLYNELIGEYPFANEKYGHAQFGWGGGMEHQTMSFMGAFTFRLIAHEMAHQWFGDYITLGTWQDIWLNEGFATYLNALAIERLRPEEWPSWKKSTVEQITNSTAGSVFVDDTASVSRIFNYRLSYLKGSYLLHMLRWVIGDDAFYAGLQNYFNDPEVANGFATNDQLVAHMEQAGDTTLQAFFEDWYYGEGYPIYTLTYWLKENNKVEIQMSQTTSHTSVEFFEMPVPVRFYNSDRTKSADFTLNNTSNNQVFTLDPGFEVAKIELDPDYWLISRLSQIVKVPEVSQKQRLNIYPNPSIGLLNLSMPDNDQLIKSSIYSMDGELLKVFNGSNNMLNISNLSSGTYLLKVETRKNIFREKLIKY